MTHPAAFAVGAAGRLAAAAATTAVGPASPGVPSTRQWAAQPSQLGRLPATAATAAALAAGRQGAAGAVSDHLFLGPRMVPGPDLISHHWHLTQRSDPAPRLRLQAVSFSAAPLAPAGPAASLVEVTNDIRLLEMSAYACTDTSAAARMRRQRCACAEPAQLPQPCIALCWLIPPSPCLHSCRTGAEEGRGGSGATRCANHRQGVVRLWAAVG